MQALAERSQTLTILLQTLAHGAGQPLLQGVQLRTQARQLAFGMLGVDALAELLQLTAACRQLLLQRAAQAQFQLIQTLGLLGQTLPRMAQTGAQVIETLLAQALLLLPAAIQA